MHIFISLIPYSNLVFTFGAITIILFVGLNATAANVVRVLVDDALIRSRLRRLTQGLPAMVLWMLLTIIWIFVLAGVTRAWTTDRMGSYTNFSFPDNVWYSYITITTVGFGDFHIPHEEFRARDMFSIPLLILLGFVILGTFAEKLMGFLEPFWPQFEDFEQILEATRPPEPGRDELEQWRKKNGEIDVSASNKSAVERRHSL